jgi:diguanylate cyclase (GGDEF)-like protein
MKAALIVAEKVRTGISAAPVNIGEAQLTVTTSVGVAEFQPNQDIGFSIKHADDALYAAKRRGRNRVEWTPRPPAI